MNGQVTLAYMSPQEEADIKRNIPWDDIDVKILKTVKFANNIPGIATIYSCAGHTKPDRAEIFMEYAYLRLRFTKDYTPEQMLNAALCVGISDVSFCLSNKSVWVYISVEPGYRKKLREFLKVVNGEVV